MRQQKTETIMTDNTQLTAYLNEYLNMTNPQFAVMISGKWGCGKTYYIKERIKEWSEPKSKVSDDVIELKPIYVSVNGINTISSVVRQIKTKLYPILYSKGVAVAKKVALSVLQIVAKSKIDLDADGSGEDLKSLLDIEDIIEVFKSDSSSLKGNRVLVFDDVERCRVPLDELFGFINGIVEHSDSKVILLCDEDKLTKVAEQEGLKIGYKEFKEKLVGQTFSLDVDYAAIVGAFIDAKKSPVLSANRDLIIELFVASKFENLRLARHCLIDIVRFFGQLPVDVSKNQNYQSFVTNVVAYLTIVSLEARSGNTLIRKYQSHNHTDEDIRVNHELEDKYNPILDYRRLYNSVYTIPIVFLEGFVQTGYIDSPDQLMTGCRMLQMRNLANWEKLWRCDNLSNEEFLKLLKVEKSRFYNKKLEYVFEVAHLAGILLSLEKRKLVKLSRNYVVSIAKSNIDDIYHKFPNDMQRIMMNSHGYEFLELQSSEMTAIVSYASGLFQKRINKLEKEYVQKVWNSLGPDTTFESLNQQFDEATPTNRCAYSMECIFTQVSPRVLADKIVALPNSAKNEFAHFIARRYYLKESGVIGSISVEMRGDKQNLAKVSALLKKSAKRLKLLDKEKTLMVAAKIDEAVAKL